MKLKLYNRRYGIPSNISIERTSEGWDVRDLHRGGRCYKNGELLENHEMGEQSLFRILDQAGPEGFSYPSDLGIYMEMLWERAEKLMMNDDEIQKNLDVLSEWIQKVEDGKPDPSLWEFSGWELNHHEASEHS